MKNYHWVWTWNRWVWIGLISLSIAGCATVPVSRNISSPIVLPEPPERFAWHQDGVPPRPGTIYLDPYQKLKPKESIVAPDDGGILVPPKTWRGIKYGLTEWPRWGDIVQKIVDAHNAALKQYNREEDNSWWRILKWNF